MYLQFCRINFNLNIDMCESIRNTDYQLSCEHVGNTSQINGTKLQNETRENYAHQKIVYFNESINFDSDFESNSFLNDTNYTEYAEFWNQNETIVQNQSSGIYMPNKKEMLTTRVVANNSNKKYNISILTSNVCNEKLLITKEISLFVVENQYFCKCFVYTGLNQW